MSRPQRKYASNSSRTNPGNVEPIAPVASSGGEITIAVNEDRTSRVVRVESEYTFPFELRLAARVQVGYKVLHISRFPRADRFVVQHIFLRAKIL